MRAARPLAIALILAGAALAPLPARAQTTAPTTGQTADPAALTARAESGEAAAQYALAERYHHGDGVLQNYARAADWYERAARQGLAEAQNRLGQYYHSGLGRAIDQTEALRWLRAAAEQGDPEHLFNLAMALENGADGSQDPAAAAPTYAAAADQGHVGAMTSLGVLYQNGTGVAQDFARALALYERAAAAGDARAQNNLGLMYVRGTGIGQDYARAVALFQAATDQGLRTAMTNLGVMYANGFGVPHDEARAEALYRAGGQGGAAPASAFTFDPRLVPPTTDPDSLAALESSARAGDPVAAFLLGWVLSQQAPGDPVVMRQAADWFRQAADRGHGAAMANLGLLYQLGLGLPQDYMLAQMWLTLAQATGLDTGAARHALSARMTPKQINTAQARAAAHRRTSTAKPATDGADKTD
jgi:TPR repeat protein